MQSQRVLAFAKRVLRVPAVRWLLGIALIALTVLFINPSQFADVLKDVRWAFAVPAILGLTLMHAINAAGWGVMSRLHTGFRMPMRTTMLVYYASMSLGLLTPSNIGSDVYRTTAMAENAGGWRRAALPVALQRITSFLALGVLGLVASAFLPVSAGLKISVIAMMVAMLGALAGFVWLSGQPRTRFARVQAWIGRGQQRGEAEQSRAWRLMGVGLATGLIFHGCSLLLALVLLNSLTPDVPVAGALAALALARLAILIPVSISGLGFQEGAAALLFPAAGLPAEVGVAVSVLSRAGLLLTAAIGAVCLSVATKNAKRRAETNSAGTSTELAA